MTTTEPEDTSAVAPSSEPTRPHAKEARPAPMDQSSSEAGKRHAEKPRRGPVSRFFRSLFSHLLFAGASVAAVLGYLYHEPILRDVGDTVCAPQVLGQWMSSGTRQANRPASSTTAAAPAAAGSTAAAASKTPTAATPVATTPVSAPTDAKPATAATQVAVPAHPATEPAKPAAAPTTIAAAAPAPVAAAQAAAVAKSPAAKPASSPAPATAATVPMTARVGSAAPSPAEKPAASASKPPATAAVETASTAPAEPTASTPARATPAKSDTEPAHTLVEEWTAARQAHAKGKSDAVDAYLRLAARYPDNPDLTGELGNIFYQKGDMSAAAEQYLETGLRLIRRQQKERAACLVPVLERLDPERAKALKEIAGGSCPSAG